MKHVPHLYLPPPWSQPSLAVSTGQAGHLQRVLRTEEGAPISYTDGEGTIGEGRWVSGRVERGDETGVERPSRLVVAVAPPTNRDRARFLVEKLSEVGVESIRWLETRHGGRRIPSPTKLATWSVSALEQSRGGWRSEVAENLCRWADLEEPVAVCVPGAPTPGRGELAVRTLVVGPEGGLDPDEIPVDAVRVGLGPTILRIETAALVTAWYFA